MTISKRFQLTQTTWTFLRFASCFILACQVLQSHGLRCYDCLYLPEVPDFEEDGYTASCLNPVEKKTPDRDCKPSVKYCEKRYTKATYGDGYIQEYLIRECSEITKTYADSELPVCFAVDTKEESTHTSHESSSSSSGKKPLLKIKKKRQEATAGEKPKPEPEQNYTYTTTSSVCLCKGDYCNKKAGVQIQIPTNTAPVVMHFWNIVLIGLVLTAFLFCKLFV